MSHASDEGDNYWPGYVDALTSMVQVLAFVMMMLAMAVFVLSQSITKNAVEAIAKAAKLDVKSTGNVKELTGDIIEKLQNLTRLDPSTERTPAADATPQTTDVPPQNAPPKSAQPESAAPSSSAAGETVARLTPSSRIKQEQADITPPANAPRILLEFGSKNFRLDPERSAALGGFVTNNRLTEVAGTVVIQAFAWSGEGALSEARRLAYYRAMIVRKQIVEQKVRADDIRINVHDTSDKEQGSTAEVFVTNEKVR